MRRSILKEKTKEELIPKPRDQVFEVKKSTIGMPVAVGDKSRAGWRLPLSEPILSVEHKAAPGNTGGNVVGANILKQGEKMPVLAEEGEIEDIRVPPEVGIKRMVGSEGDPIKERKLTIKEKFFGVKKELGEITPQYQPDTKVYRGRTSRRRISQE